MFNQLVEFDPGEHTHDNGAKQRTWCIDRIFLSWPGWALTSIQAVAEVRELPESLEQRNISDHAPVLAVLRHRFSPPPDERQMPRRLF